MQSFNTGVAKRLGHYVYRLIDPRSGQTFYVGRGHGNRVFAHVNDKLTLGEDEDDLSEKLKTIREIKSAGLVPIHVVHRHGMNETMAAEVEAALIDIIPGLTNIQAGRGSNERGPAHVVELDRRYAREIMVPDPDHKLLYIKTNQDTVDRTGDLYEAVRSAWVLNPDRAKEADYVLAVVGGVCRGVFLVDAWTRSKMSDRRWEFDGCEVHDDAARRYTGKLIPADKRKPGMAAPVLYSW